MNKKISFLLVLLLALCLTACASTESGGKVSNSPAGSQGELDAEKPKPEEKSPEITFKELTMIDNEACIVKISDIDPDNMWGFTLKANLENKSQDKTYMFAVQSAAVNGVQSDPLFAKEVAPGKKANEDIIFMDSALQENEIGAFTDIELTIRVYDSNDWLAEEAALETVHIYPYGEDKASTFTRELQPTDQLLIDNEYATAIVTGYTEDSIWGYTVNLFLVNKSDKEVMFSVKDASVNGYMADPFFAKAVTAGKCAFGSMSWSDSTLEENSIAEIEEIEFTLRIYDNNDWLAEAFAEENIILNP